MATRPWHEIRRPDPFDTVLSEVRRSVPSGYSRADWELAADTLLERHRGRVIERIRVRLEPIPMSRRPDQLQPVYEDAVTVAELWDLLDREKARDE